MNTYYIYIMTNKSRSTLYTGVTNGLTKRVLQHREKSVPGFTSRYNLNLLVCFESFVDVREAIAREKQIKGWSRKKKEELILAKNPKWGDLAVTVLGLEPVKGVPWRDRGNEGGA